MQKIVFYFDTYKDLQNYCAELDSQGIRHDNLEHYYAILTDRACIDQEGLIMDILLAKTMGYKIIKRRSLYGKN